MIQIQSTVHHQFPQPRYCPEPPTAPLPNSSVLERRIADGPYMIRAQMVAGALSNAPTELHLHY